MYCRCQCVCLLNLSAQKLGFCGAASRAAKPRGDIECTICKFILKYAEEYLAKNATEVSTYVCTYVCVVCVCAHMFSVWFCVMVRGSSHHCVWALVVLRGEGKWPCICGAWVSLLVGVGDPV